MGKEEERLAKMGKEEERLAKMGKEEERLAKMGKEEERLQCPTLYIGMLYSNLSGQIHLAKYVPCQHPHHSPPMILTQVEHHTFGEVFGRKCSFLKVDYQCNVGVAIGMTTPLPSWQTG